MTEERTINIMRNIEELRLELKNADPVERAQIEAELKQARVDLAAATARDDAERAGEAPH